MKDRPEIPGAEWDGLVRVIFGAAIELHKSLGPGFLESFYQRGMVVELRAAGLHTTSEVEVPVSHRGVHLGRQRIDLVVGGQAVVELKAVRKLDPAHFAQVRSYLAASGLPVGLLINFAGAVVECRRVYSPADRQRFLGFRDFRVRAPSESSISAAAAPPTPESAGA